MEDYGLQTNRLRKRHGVLHLRDACCYELRKHYRDSSDDKTPNTSKVTRWDYLLGRCLLAGWAIVILLVIQIAGNHRRRHARMVNVNILLMIVEKQKLMITRL